MIPHQPVTESCIDLVEKAIFPQLPLAHPHMYKNTQITLLSQQAYLKVEHAVHSNLAIKLKQEVVSKIANNIIARCH